MNMNESTWQYTVQDFSPLLTYAGSNSSQELYLNAAWSQSCPLGGSAPLSGNTLCDVESVHTTSISGASISLPFYGQGIDLLGLVSGGMEYDVIVDGSAFPVVPSPPTRLTSISNLTLGTHTIMLKARPLASDSSLSFRGALVTVGTGLTGANITSSIIQDTNPVVRYTSSPANFWTTYAFDTWGIRHAETNSTWHQLDANRTGSFTIPFTGNAILLHGMAWSYNPSNHRISIDDQPSTTIYANRSLANVGNPGYIYTDGLIYFQGNLSNDPHILTVDNDQGAGFLGLDYVEVITITGGSPFNATPPQPTVSPSPKHNNNTNTVPIGKILGPTLGIGIPLLIILTIFAITLRRRRRRLRRSDPLHGEDNPIVTPFVPADAETPSLNSEKTRTNASAATSSNPVSGFPVHRTQVSSSSYPTTPASASSNDLYASSGRGGRYLNEKRPHVANASSTVPSTPGTETPDQIRVRELQAELALARASGDVNTTELQAMRRDLQQLMQMVGNPRFENEDSPPEYGAPARTG